MQNICIYEITNVNAPKMAILSTATLKSPPPKEEKSFTTSEKNMKEMGVDTPTKMLKNMPMRNMQISKLEAYLRS